MSVGSFENVFNENNISATGATRAEAQAAFKMTSHSYFRVKLAALGRLVIVSSLGDASRRRISLKRHLEPDLMLKLLLPCFDRRSSSTPSPTDK